MDYSADLPINTMGRRIRTRLYFTSESHLHTVLNALRFAGDNQASSLLSEQGVAIINGTPELCYLTQIVMRVFEDSDRPMDDPKRFRVEILFSPGATATPFHLDETNRDSDASRFDTAPLQMIGREGLTCQEVEDFFEEVIMSSGEFEDDEIEESLVGSADKVPEGSMDRNSQVDAMPSKDEAEVTGGAETPPLPLPTTTQSEAVTPDLLSREVIVPSATPDGCSEPSIPNGCDPEDDGTPESVSPSKPRGRVFWNCVAVGSVVLGLACLTIAMQSTGRRRRWSRY